MLSKSKISEALSGYEISTTACGRGRITGAFDAPRDARHHVRVAGFGDLVRVFAGEPYSEGNG